MGASSVLAETDSMSVAVAVAFPPPWLSGGSIGKLSRSSGISELLMIGWEFLVEVAINPLLVSKPEYQAVKYRV